MPPGPMSAPAPAGTTAAAANAPAELNPIASAAAMAVFFPDHRGGLTAGAVADGPPGVVDDADDAAGASGTTYPRSGWLSRITITPSFRSFDIGVVSTGHPGSSTLTIDSVAMPGL
ncbi:MAG TPA: hypothetical protein VES02_04620 [Dermatophilaceae bacterium]|nr:hypothetical protein [Dermatophilaceae bacterium]